MDITGKVIVFSKKINEELTFSTTISRKNKDGVYENVSLTVFFNGELKEKAKKLKEDIRYTLEDVSGFLSCYKSKIQVFITEARITEYKEYKRKEVDKTATLDGLPF